MNVLIMDDNPGNRELLKEALNSRCVHALEAQDGARALEVMKTNAADPAAPNA